MRTTSSFDPGRVSTITVDSYGTLVNTDAVEQVLAAHVPEPEPVSKLWRSRSLMYTMIANSTGFYKPFYEMNREALEYSLAVHGIELKENIRDEILSTYHELEVFNDVRDGIERLVDGGYEVYVISNGNPEMLESMVEHAEIGDIISDAISAHEIEKFKPLPEIYRHGADRTATPIEEIVHVAGPAFDIIGAMNAGMQGAWLTRGKNVWEPFAGVEPDLTMDTFHDLADALDV
jgi:2-haloacid dehalogenase